MISCGYVINLTNLLAFLVTFNIDIANSWSSPLLLTITLLPQPHAPVYSIPINLFVELLIDVSQRTGHVFRRQCVCTVIVCCGAGGGCRSRRRLSRVWYRCLHLAAANHGLELAGQGARSGAEWKYGTQISGNSYLLHVDHLVSLIYVLHSMASTVVVWKEVKQCNM